MKPVHWNSELPGKCIDYKSPQSKYLYIQTTKKGEFADWGISDNKCTDTNMGTDVLIISAR